MLCHFSEYVFSEIQESCYARVLNIPFLKYKRSSYASALNIPYLKCKKSSVTLGFLIYLSQNIRKFHYAWVLNIHFLNHKMFFRVSISWKIKNFFWDCCFPKNKNSFLLRKYIFFGGGFCFLTYIDFLFLFLQAQA